ncbi:MAG: peptidylprolyl isomerase [Parvibaculaceae bacterium]|nr:peptidylprolyl isomerase [Parvibaculaceae bacterium]
MRKLLRDPLVHFLAAGGLLFLLYGAVGTADEEGDELTISVGYTELLVFLQQQSKKFDPAQFVKVLDEMPEQERDALIDEYVRQEVLVREAKRLGLEKKDYVIRRRLIQKMEFLTDGYAKDLVALDEADLRAYYEQHLADYLIEPKATFAHVFIDPRKHSADEMDAVVAQVGDTLRGQSVPFSDAPKHGDRFPFHVNYVDKSDAFIATHFGDAFRAAVFESEANANNWQGPYSSTYGQHYVLMTKRTEARQPTFEEVGARVSADANRQALRDAQEEAIADVVAGYDVEIDETLRGAP